MLVGIGLLDSQALTGAALMFIAHALLTAGLFLVVGILHVDHALVDELRLCGRARRSRLLAVGWFAGTLGLIGTPYVGVYLGHGLIDEGATQLGRSWVLPLVWLGSALAGAALLRAGGRIFLGLGDDDDPLLGQRLEEDPVEHRVLRSLLVGAALVSITLGVVVSVVPGLGQRAEYAADRFRDTSGYAAIVLHEKPMSPPPSLPVSVEHTSVESALYGVSATIVALGLAFLGLYRRRLPGSASGFAARVLAPPIHVLRELHSGVVGDYVTWVAVGTAVTGAAWALLLH
jgi:multicomponent Na+:H+ antiporter subunit D